MRQWRPVSAIVSALVVFDTLHLLRSFFGILCKAWRYAPFHSRRDFYARAWNSYICKLPFFLQRDSEVVLMDAPEFYSTALPDEYPLDFGVNRD